MENQTALTNFVEVATRYCQWAESVPDKDSDDLKTAQRLLAELHLAVLLLPETDPENEHKTERLSKEQFDRVRQRFSELPIQGYWDIFNPLVQEEPVFNSLPDDLADTYHDIQEYFSLYEKGHYDGAVWHWRFNFQIHWGHHLVGAQRAIQQYYFDAL